MGKWNTELSDADKEKWSAFYNKEVKYLCPEDIHYHSHRYNEDILVRKGYPSDGATGAVDVDSIAWWVHDVMCDSGVWLSGLKLVNSQASTVLRDILWHDGFWFRANRWMIATWLFGGGQARKNGMW